MKAPIFFLVLLTGLFWAPLLPAQEASSWWHGIKRKVHYRPDGEDFLLAEGKRRFNRALYGGNTAFRVEAGDLPEFALYLPGMGGNLKFGLAKAGESKWLTDADKIETRYRPGSMRYSIEDRLLGGGRLQVTVLALHEGEGLVVKAEGKNIPADVRLVAAFGGATGQKFSRDGDIGADPETSFYLKPDDCRDNFYHHTGNRFALFFGSRRPPTDEERNAVPHLKGPQLDSALAAASRKMITGLLPSNAAVKTADASQQASPLSFFHSNASATPALAAQVSFSNAPLYFLIRSGRADTATPPAVVFARAQAAATAVASQIKVVTPDPYLNTLGAALSTAADAVWEDPSYLHGAVAWRMRLNGWRGAYLADVLGWHDRARKHFSSYALSQVTSPATGPVVMDTALHLARGLEKLGTSVYSSGYISRNPGGDKRPHHYDMNLVFVDQLLNHFDWTGDTAYVRQTWPLLVRHLDWEKRNFDRDGDGLYDAYAAIWASDALQYSGGGVAHSSAYNYRSNKRAAELAKRIGEDGAPYEAEAAKILQALNEKLWLKERGWLAEYKDLLGEKLVHPYAGLWTVYHALDSKVPDAFQASQMLRYVDSEIPHIPVRAEGLTDTTLYTLSTTNWQPYTWSLNNVVLGEVQHTALAYWQGGRSEEAYKLFKSSLVESMYLGASPGNFQQLSFYDAIRGELYRDFADDIGTTARSLVEGLFGIYPTLLENKIEIRPGFPAAWDHASLTTPDVAYAFRRKGNKETHSIRLNFLRPRRLLLRLKARAGGVASVRVNGRRASWQWDTAAVGGPVLLLDLPAANSFVADVSWQGPALETPALRQTYKPGETLTLAFKQARLLALSDPQQAVGKAAVGPQRLQATVGTAKGTKTIFLRIRQGSALYWLPLSFAVEENAAATKSAAIFSGRYEKVDLSDRFNDDVKNIFANQYLSPRPQTTTLQLPTQGIGNWAYPLTTAVIDDSGLRRRAGEKNEVVTGDGVPFSTPSASGAKNVVFTSQWDNYPKAVSLPLSGKAAGAAFLLAGSTNPMQSQLANGLVAVRYKDGSADTLVLENPRNWWPIEQDYYEDGYAFTTGAPKPLRVYLKSGDDTRSFKGFVAIKGFSNRGINGGAATVLQLSLDPQKELDSLTLRSIANDVVIGLMAVTLLRTK